MEIKNRAGAVIYKSDKAKTIRELVEEAMKLAADLSGANLPGVDLQGLKTGEYKPLSMPGAHLKGAQFSVIDCPAANFSGADLSGANFFGAKLKGANFSKANLTGANLIKADLTRANLEGANLTGVDLASCNLAHANMSDAVK